MNRMVAKINELVDAVGNLGTAASRGVDTQDVPAASTNLPTSRAVYAFASQLLSGTWLQYKGSLQSGDDINPSAKPGDVYISQEDKCVYLVLENAADVSLYATIDGSRHVIDSTNAISADELVSGTMSGQSFPFADRGFTKITKLTAYGFRADTLLIPVRLDSGYIIVLCSSDTITDGRCIIKAVSETKKNAINAVSFNALNIGEVKDCPQAVIPDSGVAVVAPFGGGVKKVALATKEWVESIL